jgi:hypoxanthine phosphoribosyltransferase
MTEPTGGSAAHPMTEPTGGPGPRPSFAHASEAELARILDFYDVRWAYEPDTFPIGWSLDGGVVESFSPDFYLPDLDLYVELTTLKQKLVRKKNRKLRRLRELYPDVRIKLFYARDFRQLLLKFGRLALIDELTGTSGQATPPRADDADDAVPLPAGSGRPSTRVRPGEPSRTRRDRRPEPAADATATPAAGRTCPSRPSVHSPRRAGGAADAAAGAPLTRPCSPRPAGRAGTPWAG